MKNYFTKSNSFTFFSLVIIVMVGSYFRLVDLTFAAIGVDEFYSIKSIQNILSKGVPEFSDGGLYLRGIFYQYFVAFLVKIGIKIEFAGRVIPAILNILTIPAIYLISKKIVGNLPSLLIVMLFSFSVWEIEMSRFARMYVPFQFIFFWYIYNLLLLLAENNKKSKIWLYILSFISLFVYEGAIFLVVLNFVPFVWNKKINKKDFLISTAIFVVGFLYLRTDFVHFNITNYLPTDIESTVGFSSPIVIPYILATTINVFSLWSIIFVGIILFGIYSFFILNKNQSLDNHTKFSLIIFSIFSILNLFTLLILTAILLLLSGWIKRDILSSKEIKLFLLFIILSFLFWMFYGLFTDWYLSFPRLETKEIYNKVFIALFNFPELFYYLRKFIQAIPIYSIFTGLFFIILLFTTTYNVDKSKKILNILIFLFISLILLSTIIKTGSFRTRYLFYFFPITFMLNIYVLEYISKLSKVKKLFQDIILLVLFSSFIILGEDFNIFHLVNLNNPNNNYRVNYSNNTARHFYESLYDFKDVANIINEKKQKDEIIIIDQPNISFYLNHDVDYFYADQSHDRMRNISINSGNNERWLDSKLLYKGLELKNLLESNRGVWFVTYSKPQFYYEKIDFYNSFNKNHIYTSLDGFTNIYHIPQQTSP